MHTEILRYSDADATLAGFVAFDPSNSGPRPVVLVCHAWAGQDEFSQKFAIRLAGLGYLAMALDVYGEGVRGNSPAENQRLMEPFIHDRARLLRRLEVAVHAISQHDRADRTRISAVGFCFGGLCVLDLARARIKHLVGVVSFHGLLIPTTVPSPKGAMHTKVLCMHGYNDPMVRPDAVAAFAREMTDAECDWTIQMYGHRGHAFMNPVATFPEQGMSYCPVAEERSLHAMEGFLREVFADKQRKIGRCPVPV